VIGVGIALLSGLVATALLLPGGFDAAGVSLAGVGVLTWGVSGRAETRVLAGSALLFVAILLGGLRELAPGLLLGATVTAVVAWDAATYVVDSRAQLDARAEIRRAVLAHTGATLAATTAIAAVVYAAFLFGGSVSPLAALLVLLGAVLVAMGLAPHSGD